MPARGYPGRGGCRSGKVDDDLTAVAAYYDSQPLGVTAAYRILETRSLADDLVLGYLAVDFSFTDRPTLSVYLSVLVKRTEKGWYISHYQVSRLD